MGDATGQPPKAKKTNQPTTEWLQQKQKQNRSFNLNLIEMLWQDLKRAIHTSRLNWNSFGKRNGPKFLLTVVQVWSATTGNVWLRLSLPKEGQPVIKSKGSYTFSVNVYMLCSRKTWKHIIVCVVLVQADCVCLLLWLRWRSEHILWPVHAEIQTMPKGSHTFPCNCIFSQWNRTQSFWTRRMIKNLWFNKESVTLFDPQTVYVKQP